MTYKNILVVLNNHGSNHPALDKSALIARIEKKVRITLFMPIFDFTLEIASLASATERKSMLEKVIASKKEELKSEVSAFLYDPDTVIEYKVTWNRSPETAIFSEIESGSYDLIIKNTVPAGVGAGVLFTPDDWQLLRSSDLPVMLVKEHEWPVNGNIILALTFSQNPAQKRQNVRLYRHAQMLSRLTASQIHLVNAVPQLDMGIATLDMPGFVPGMFAEAVHQSNKILIDEFVKQHPIPEDHIHILDGIPEDVICEQAKKLNSLAVIMGTVGRDGLSGAILGNTAEQIVDNINCDLVVVRDRI